LVKLSVVSVALRSCLTAATAALALSTAAPALAARTAQVEKADKVVVVKRERRLYLLRGGEVLTSFRVALGKEPRGTKLHEGDGRTPEGRYVLDARNGGSNFYRALHVSYPSNADRARARALGERAGGLIMVHGLPNERPDWGEEHWLFNWTNGCIAVTNDEMDEIWERVDLGTPIEIRP
jgi:murein L,D-transpeptidase YafK